MTRNDRIALVLAFFSLIAVFWVTQQVFEGLPHIEDEYAYIWQAQTATRGDLTLESPVCPKCFLQPFVVDYQGLRFGKYPPGWPAALSIAIQLNLRDWLNPFLAALCVWLTYRLVKRLLNEKAGLLAAFLTLMSPFFLINGGTLLSHVWSYFLTLTFILSWLDAITDGNPLPGWLPVTTGGLSLGLLVLTRPLTAVGVALPFFIHGLVLLTRGSKRIRAHILFLAAIAGILALIIPLWQYAVTGDLLLNPYSLWWPYDRLGFGPGIGRQAGGNDLHWAYINGTASLRVGASDLFGWPMISWLFMPFGLIAMRHNDKGLLVSSVLASLVLVYTLYWIGSWVFGPRYYFEGIVSAVLMAAAGIHWLAGRIKPISAPLRERILSAARFGLTAAVLLMLIAGNLRYYLPLRFQQMTHLYGISRQQLVPFRQSGAVSLTPALVIVHQMHTWREYAVLLELADPYLDTPFIFTYSRGPEQDQSVIDAYAERNVYHYYADDPFALYKAPR
ncbi:MAG: STT3 domain-containing protein [Bellilinea sp.]